jgi:hypothetical protein
VKLGLSLLLLALMGIVVFGWAALRLIHAARLRKRGFGVHAEDRRLRDDPRFTEIWVQQYRKEPPPEEKGPPAAS